MNPLPPVISELINRFEQNHQAYHSDPYNETQLRREFVDPFFEALGWDVNNKQGYVLLSVHLFEGAGFLPTVNSWRNYQ